MEGDTTSCGCVKRNTLGDSRRGKKFGPSKRRRDLTNHRYGIFRVKQIAHTKGSRVWWKCLCSCGNFFNATTDKIVSRHTKPCGCRIKKVLRERNATPEMIALAKDRGVSGTRKLPEYAVWIGMIGRCADPNNEDYQQRGITICQRWRKSFLHFYQDVGPRPTPQHSLERKDNNGNYEPGNCKWATQSEQCLNRRKPKRSGRHWITCWGRRQHLSAWCREVGISSSLYHIRRRAGDTIRQALRPKTKFTHRKPYT